MDNGYIQLHRKLLDNPIFLNAELLQLFIYCLLKANHKPNPFIWNGKEITVERGQFITGLNVMTLALNQSQTSTYRRLKLLESLGYIQLKAENKFTLLTICKYNNYQSNKSKDGKQTENKRKTNGKQTETNNNDNNDNNDNKRERAFIKPSLSEVESYFEEKGIYKTKEPEKFLNFHDSKGWMIGKNKMKDWRAAIRTWISRLDIKPIKTEIVENEHGKFLINSEKQTVIKTL